MPVAYRLPDEPYASIISFALVVVIILSVLGLRDALLDLMGAVWERLGNAADRFRPAPASRTCPRCGSRLVTGTARCDVCAEKGIPDAPAEPAWKPPAELTVSGAEFASSATWTKPDFGRDFPTEVARLRATVALGLMLALALCAWWVALGQPRHVDWPLLLLGLVDVMMADLIRRLWALAVGLAVVLAVLTAVYVAVGLGLHPTVAVLASVLAAGGVAQAYPAVALLRGRRSQPKPA